MNAPLIQGSQEWLAHRRNFNNASDAPAMMGVSLYPNKTRTNLLKEKSTGITEEVNSILQKKFDDGHRYEALARGIAEGIVGETLSPVTLTRGNLSASFDGLVFDGSTSFEHKSLNDEIRACKSAADLPEMYRVQMEQQFYVAGDDCKQCLFMASKWDESNNLIEEMHFWVEPDLELRARIIAGWKQFEIDLANYQPTEAAPVIVAAEIEDLPALTVELVGQVTRSNLASFKSIVMARIEAISTDLNTDEDFVIAGKTVKFLDNGEKRLELVKSQALSQTASIDELFRTVDSLKEQMRAKRLTLDKLVKARKESIKLEILNSGKDAIREHINTLHKRLGGVYMVVPVVDFADAMKGKQLITSLRDAVSTELANAKIEANAVADAIQINLTRLAEVPSHMLGLFSDRNQIVMKGADDLDLLIKSRISEHAERENAKLEAERTRIRAEESAKAEATAKAETERQLKAQREEIEAKQKAEAAESRRIEDERKAAASACIANDEPALNLTTNNFKVLPIREISWQDVINALQKAGEHDLAEFVLFNKPVQKAA